MSVQSSGVQSSGVQRSGGETIRRGSRARFRRRLVPQANRRQRRLIRVAGSSGGFEQCNQVVEGFGGSTILGLERRVRLQSKFRWTMEQTACDGTQDAVADDDKHGGCFAAVAG